MERAGQDGRRWGDVGAEDVHAETLYPPQRGEAGALALRVVDGGAPVGLHAELGRTNAEPLVPRDEDDRAG